MGLERKRNVVQVTTRVGLLAGLIVLVGCQPASKAADLFDASASCDLPEAKAALTAKANVNARSDADATPLIVASGNGCVDVAQKLISAGADVNAKTGDKSSGISGTTALMSASASHPDVVKLLIAAGADLNAKDSTGATALVEAATYGQLEVAQELVAAGTDVNAKDLTGQTPLSWAENTHRFGTAKGHADVAAFLRQHGGK